MSQELIRPRRAIVYAMCLLAVYLGVLAAPAWTRLHVTYDESTDSLTMTLGMVTWLTSTRSVVAPPAGGAWRDGVLIVRGRGAIGLAGLTLMGAMMLSPVWRALVRAHPVRGRCDGCGYLLTGGALRCPECGETGRNPLHRMLDVPQAVQWRAVVLLGIVGVAFLLHQGLGVADEIRQWPARTGIGGLALAPPPPLPRWPVLVVLGLASIWAVLIVVAWARLTTATERHAGAP